MCGEDRLQGLYVVGEVECSCECDVMGWIVDDDDGTEDGEDEEDAVDEYVSGYWLRRQWVNGWGEEVEDGDDEESEQEGIHVVYQQEWSQYY